MGSSNRDYMQEDYDTRGPAFGHDIPATKWLLIVTVVVFFLQFFLTHEVRVVPRSIIDTPPPVIRETGYTKVIPVVRGPGFGGLSSFEVLEPSYVEEWFLLDAGKVLKGQVWRLVTYVFCHPRNDPFDLVFNMVMLWFLGSTLERMYGSREILWFYLTAAFACGLIFTAFGLKIPLSSPLMDSTPCIMAMFALYATHFPRQEILFAWIVPMQIRMLLGIYVAVDVFKIMSACKHMAPIETIAYLSVLWGIGFGYCYKAFDWRLAGIGDALDFRKVQRSLRRATTARNLKVYAPEPVTNLDEQVDAILEKIHLQGSESLTDRERSILQRASEQAKNRM